MGNSTCFEWSIANQPYPGQIESGDQYLVAPFEHGILAAVVDGLGHGTNAALSAKTIVKALDQKPGESVVDLLNHGHRAARGTRGAAVSLASINLTSETLTWLGVGNVKGLLLRANNSEHKREWLMGRGGIVGYNLPTLRPVTLNLYPGDTLIFVTDGIKSDFSEALSAANSPAEITAQILQQYQRNTDDSLALALRYKGKAL